jgi:hypothetical protein
LKISLKNWSRPNNDQRFLAGDPKGAGWVLLGQYQFSALGNPQPVVFPAMHYPNLGFARRKQILAFDGSRRLGLALVQRQSVLGLIGFHWIPSRKR